MPPSLKEWLPENDLAYFVSDIAEQMKLTAIEAVYEKEERGYPPYHPVMMVKVLLYAYSTGVYSSRRIAKRLQGMWPSGFLRLATNLTSERSAISENDILNRSRGCLFRWWRYAGRRDW